MNPEVEAKPETWFRISCSYENSDVRDGMKPARRRMLLKSWPSIVIPPIATFLVLITANTLRDHGYSVPWWVDWAIVAVIFIAVMKWQRHRVAHQIMSHFGPWQRPHVFEFNQAGVTIMEPLSSSQYRWEAFCGWSESGGVFILKVSLYSGVAIPRRFIGGAAEVEQFRNMLRERVRIPTPSISAFPVLPPVPRDARTA